jgi:peptide/nickel transport system permease protein
MALPPLLSPCDPKEGNLVKRLQPPFTDRHLLGTDALGRDLLSRIVHGARVSVSVGLTAVLIAGFFGTLLGLISGFYGGWTDRIIMRFVDVQLSCPFVVLALTIAAILGPSFQNIIITLAISSWVLYIRLVRGEVLAIKENSMSKLGRSGFQTGASYVPYCSQRPVGIIAFASLEVGRMIITEAAISFWLCIQPPTPSWGSMLSEGREYMTTGVVVNGLSRVGYRYHHNGYKYCWGHSPGCADPKLRVGRTLFVEREFNPCSFPALGPSACLLTSSSIT